MQFLLWLRFKGIDKELKTIPKKPCIENAFDAKYQISLEESYSSNTNSVFTAIKKVIFDILKSKL